MANDGSNGTDTSTTDETNGKKRKRSEKLDELHAEFLASKVKLSKSDAKALLAGFLKLEKEGRELEDALTAHKQKMSDHCEKMVRGAGKGSFKAGGVVYTAMAAGSTVFYRPETRDAGEFGE